MSLLNNQGGPKTAAQFAQEDQQKSQQNTQPVGMQGQGATQQSTAGPIRQLAGKGIKGLALAAPFCFCPPVGAAFGLTGVAAGVLDAGAGLAIGGAAKHELNHIGNAVEGKQDDQSLTANVSRGVGGFATKHPAITTIGALAAVHNKVPQRAGVYGARALGSTLQKVSEGLAGLAGNAGGKGLAAALGKGAEKLAEMTL